ncbi:MAG TPA: hypothetical protein VNY27_01290 [Solirubrobacteraceae bacterium]|nr:hypothetical protein [Solirubrobacteraceae bacterium]
MRSKRVLRIALLSPVLTVALAASASGATAIHFQSESLPALQAQLHKHEVHALTFHPTPAPGRIHASMNDGRHYTVVYAAGQQATLVALAHANGARYTVAKVKPKAAKATHHTLRYIAGGIVVVVIVIVVAVLLVDRRRKLGEGDSGTTSAPGDSAT